MYTAWNIDMLLTVASFLPFFLPSERKRFISAHLKTKCPHHRYWLSIRISYWLVEKDPLLNAWKMTHEQHQPWPVPTHRNVYHLDSWAARGLMVFQAGTYFKCFSLFCLHCIPFFEGDFMPSPCTAFSRPSRSIHYRDISGSNRRETSHFFAETKWPETHWPPWIMRPRDWVREICFSFSATWMQK